MFRKPLLILGILLMAVTANATHMSGGEIYWECIGNNQYRIRLLVYRDCAGINVDPTYNLELTSPCGDRNLTVTSNGGTELSQLCDLELPNSTCNGGTLPGIEQYIYTGTITLPPCDSWQISWTNIYRNNAIVNLTAPGTREMYIEAILNSADAPCNDSPIFTNAAIPYVCLGYPISYSYGAVDGESDSLSYTLIGARMDNGDPIPYTIPYDPQAPITGLTIDPATGLLNFTLFLAGNWVVVVQVTEYDANGNVIGSIMRDMQFVAYPCANVPPDAATGLVSNLSGSATQTGPRAVQVCESGDFCFDMVINDVNTDNVLDAFSNAAQSLPGATFAFTGTNPITATLCWTAQAGAAGFYPVMVNVNDGACPIPAFQTYVYSVEVLTGLSGTVQTVDETCLGSGNGSATVNVTAGTEPYTYAWSTGSTESSIIAGAGIYTVTVTDDNGCEADLTPATIGSAALPNEANAGPDVIGCIGTFPIYLNESVTNATGGVWSGGTGTYNGTFPDIDYSPGAADFAAGSVILTLTTTGNAGCPPDSDTMELFLPNSFANVTIVHTDALCNGTSTGTAAVVPDNVNFSYLWLPDGQTTATIADLGTGTRTVTITDNYNCQMTLTTEIGEPDALSLADLVSTDESCAGEANGQLVASASGGTAPYTYTWNTGVNGATLITGAGTYDVSVTDANGCTPVTATGTILATGQPSIVDAGPDIIVCLNDYPVILQGSVVNATGGQWSGGSGTFLTNGLSAQYQPTNAEIMSGGVDLVLTSSGNPTCPPVSDTVHLNFSTALLTAALSTTAALCNASSDGTIAFTPATPGFSYLWSDPLAQTSPTATGLAAGTYSVTVTDAVGCDTTLSATVDEPQALTIAQINTTNVSCASGTNGAAALTLQGGTPTYAIAWSNGATSNNITNLQAGSYSVEVTDSHGCTAQSVADIEQPEPIFVSVQAPDTMCVNTPGTFVATATGGAGGYLFNWGGMGFNPSVQLAFQTSTTIQLTVVDQAGCTGPITPVPVTVLDLNTASFTTYGDTTVCTGGLATVGLSFSGYPGTTNIAWSPLGYTGSGPYTVPVIADQNHVVTVTDGCGTTVERIIGLRVDAAPTIALPPVIASGCAPLHVQFPNLNLGNVTYTWNLGNGTTSNVSAPQLIYPQGSYTASLTVTTPLGCTSSSNGGGQILAYASPVVSVNASPLVTNIDEATIDFTSSTTGTIVSFGWVFGDGGTSSIMEPTYEYNEIGTFDAELFVTDDHGCTGHATVPITIEPVYDVVIPTAFTPNPNGSGGSNGGGGNYVTGDLSNDVFYPFVRFVEDFRMRVFNRWGELIFESTDLSIGWDGFYRGALSPQDVYVVQTWFRFVDGKQVEKLSDLTLFR
jgi:hypothetical protein